jgi:hypothetical protein
MSDRFVRQVSRAMLLALVPVAACGALLAAWPGVVGALAGAAISLGSFRWIARGVARASRPGAQGALALSTLAVGLRHVVAFVALAVVMGSGAAHPVAVMGGLSVLPPLVILLGLRARETAS